MLVTHYVTIAIIFLFKLFFFKNHSVFINFICSFPSLTCLFVSKSKKIVNTSLNQNMHVTYLYIKNFCTVNMTQFACACIEFRLLDLWINSRYAIFHFCLQCALYIYNKHSLFKWFMHTVYVFGLHLPSFHYFIRIILCFNT